MNQRIIQGDCLIELKLLPAESIDVVTTSPPYNIGKEYNLYQDNLPYDQYLSWLGDIFVELKRVLKSDGSFFLNIGSTCKEPYINMDVCGVARKHFILQNDIVWVKSVSILDEDKYRSYGHFKPIVSKRFLNQQHESVYHFTKTGEVLVDRLGIGVPYEHKSNIDRWKHEGKETKADLRCRGNVWHLPYKTVQSKKQHSAGFPEKLPEFCVLLHGLRDNLVVLDPFMGAGTTLLACKKLGVAGIGIEIDPTYCEMAAHNLAL